MTFADPSVFPSAFDSPLATAGPASFAELGLPDRLVRALARAGLTTPFPIQAATVPDALAGRDVLGRGRTGSGKTLAFGLPLLARLSGGPRAASTRPRALVLVPTRELAMQVNDALLPLARAAGVFCRTAVGGVPYDRQIDALRRGVEVLVATPGRLGDLIRRGACSLADVEVTVLDEADQMADLGFLPEVTGLLAQTPPGGQRMLFSATLPATEATEATGAAAGTGGDADPDGSRLGVETLVRRFLTDPAVHSTDPPALSISTMDHHLLLVPPQEKFKVTAAIAARPGRTIMFARTQLGVDRLVGQLAEVGVRAGALHGGKTQRVRTRTLAEFREGRTDVLVATDVAARGIHVDGISLVLHVDPPRDARDYLHRAGRTARAGESGAVATLVLPRQRRAAAAMLAAAGVAPAETRVRAGDEALRTLTGARRPSGVPVPAAPEGPHHAARPHRPDGPQQGERRPRERHARPGGDRRPYRHRDGRPRAAAGR